MSPKIPSPVLIIGARSDIGRAIARRYASAGCDIILAARRVERLADDAADIEVRFGVRACLAECDVKDPRPERFYEGLQTLPGTVIAVAGLLGEQEVAANDMSAADEVMAVNFTGPAKYLLVGARILGDRPGGGCLIGVSSVAGDRGRASNFVYGAAKAGLTALLSGLRNSLVRRNVQVITVKPGFVATRMTAGMDLPRLLTAHPEEVADAIFRAQRAGWDVIYVKPVWRLIMALIAAIPEPIFKRMRL